MTATTVLIECLDGNGRVLARERLLLNSGRSSFTVGRSVEADVTLDDPYSAPLHAELEIMADGQVLASDLGSVNGLVIAGKRVHEAQRLPLNGNALQVGRTHLRVRTGPEQLAPELPDQARSARWLHDPAWLAGLGSTVLAAQLVYSAWLQASRDPVYSIVGILVGVALIVAVWVALWGLLSRVMRGEWRWLSHAAILVCVAAIYLGIEGIIDLAWWLLALPAWAGRNIWLGGVAIGSVLCLHLMHASSLTLRRSVQIAGIVALLLAGSAQWVLWRQQTRDVNYISAGLRLYPPALRLRASEGVADYFKAAAGLRQQADSRRNATKSDAEEPRW